MLVTSIFSFSYNVFYSVKDRNYDVILFNSLPKDNFLDRSKLKALADNKINMTQKLKFVLGMVENMGKGENAGY